MQSIGAGAASFVLALLAIYVLRPIAAALALVDKPGGRKTHRGNVPMIGGPCLLIGLSLGVLLGPFQALGAFAFLTSCSILVVVGLLDDRFDLPPWSRLLAQAGAAILFVTVSGHRVEELGSILGTGSINLASGASQLFTVFAMISAVNAFNMLDGIDGLAATLALLALGAMVTLSYEGNTAVAALGAVGIGAFAAFLVSNLPLMNDRMRCFLGDSGSTLVGFVVVAVGILASQGEGRATAPVTVLWLVALPIYDVSWAVIRRLMRGQSPLQADEDHLHHLLLRAGFTARGAFAALIGLAAGLAVLGITLEHVGVSESHSFALFAVTGFVVVRLTYSTGALRRAVATSRLASVRPLRRLRKGSART